MTRITRYISLVSLALAVVLTLGCEDSGVTAPEGSTLTVLATPSTVTIDPNVLVETPPGSGIFVPQSQGTTTITAKVVDADGDPISGVSVSFTTEAGNLGSFDEQSGTSTPVQTNSNGIATDTLTVGTADPAEIDVTANSGTVTDTATVTKVVGPVNEPPVARVTITPADEQAINLPVIFDSAASTDPDGDPITMYRWSISSSTGGVPDIVEGPGETSLLRSYGTPRTISGTLQITDDPDAARETPPIVYRSTTAFSYRIVATTCGANQAPTARITGQLSLTGAASSSVSTILDGTTSTDPEGGIASYTWTCTGATSTVPVPGTDGAQVTCTYAVQSTAKTHPATLVVKDFGTGAASGGGYTCQKVSPAATASVVVTPTAAAR